MTEIKKGRYRHFKGNEYEVLCVGKNSENLEDMVVYKALYGNGEIWIRPAKMWFDTVVSNGVECTRFTYLD